MKRLLKAIGITAVICLAVRGLVFIATSQYSTIFAASVVLGLLFAIIYLWLGEI